MVAFEWALFALTLLVVWFIHQAGHVIAVERVGLTAKRLSIGFFPFLRFRLKWFFPRTSIEIGLLPICVRKRLTETSRKSFSELAYQDRVFVHCSGGILNMLVGMFGYIVYLYMHPYLPFKFDAVIVGVALIGVYILRRWLGAYMLPLAWPFVLQLFVHSWNRGETWLDPSPQYWLHVTTKMVHGFHYWDVWLASFCALSMAAGLISLLPIPYITDGGMILVEIFRPIVRRLLPRSSYWISLRHLHTLRNLQ